MNFKDLAKKLKINERSTKGIKKAKVFTKVKDVVFPKGGYNFMADLLELPKTKAGFRYLLVVVDLWSDEFDIEPVKTTKAKEVLTAYKKMIKRGYIDKAKASIAVDGGSEFKGMFKDYLYENDIFQKVSMKNRKTQNSNVESLNRSLGRLINGYMNSIEEDTNKTFKEWNNKNILDTIRKDLNDIRRKKDGKIEYRPFINKTPKFKVGDLVDYYLNTPQNIFGNEVYGKFREGDRRWSVKPRKIKKVLKVLGDVPIRYMLNYIPNVSYTEEQLRPADKKDVEELFEVKKIIDKRKNGRKTEYLVWYKGYLKKDAYWIDEKELKRTGLDYSIDEYNKLVDKKKT
jgi:hypothetical protein